PNRSSIALAMGSGSLKAEMLVQASRLNQCLHRQDELAADAVREGQDKKAAGLIYRRLLMLE
ncbi:hypothetical protein, partial [Klebsiella pneumoniae]|uniref:hypothetical protein n=1 Tax=Klebsiella pneumoniae TaxID=573 RepID=UPI001954E39D